MTEKPKIFRQGDTAKSMMEISQPLAEGMILKAGIYNMSGKPLYETTCPDGNIQKVDDTHYLLELSNDVTRRLLGATTLRFTIYNADLSYVNSAENSMPLVWKAEPVNDNLKKTL